jgi:HPt (histidine-containing phosphotransfer) domain-containing protein
MQDDEKLRQQIADIAVRYIKRTQGELGLLREALAAIRAGDADAPKQLERLAHKIHGSGAMFGFDAISEHAHEIEKLAGSELRDADALGKIEQCLHRLEAEVAAIAKQQGSA